MPWFRLGDVFDLWTPKGAAMTPEETADRVLADSGGCSGDLLVGIADAIREAAAAEREAVDGLLLARAAEWRGEGLVAEAEVAESLAAAVRARGGPQT